MNEHVLSVAGSNITRDISQIPLFVAKVGLWHKIEVKLRVSLDSCGEFGSNDRTPIYLDAIQIE